MKSDAGTQCKTGDINSFPFNITKIGECDSLNAGERFILKVSIAAMAVTLSLMSSWWDDVIVIVCDIVIEAPTYLDLLCDTILW